MLVPELYQKLIWFLFPSEIITELLELRHLQSQLTFEAIENYVNKLPLHEGSMNTPFTPKDYSRSTFKFEFSDEYKA